MGERARVLARWTSVPLLVVSGVLLVLASVERWWPVCRYGSFDTPGCIARQDDSYETRAYPAVTGLGALAEQHGLGWWLLLAALVPTAVALFVGFRGAHALDAAWALLFLVLAFPLFSLLLTPTVIMYGSHDDHPWWEAVNGVVVLLTALFLARATRVTARAPGPHQPTDPTSRPSTQLRS